MAEHINRLTTYSVMSWTAVTRAVAESQTGFTIEMSSSIRLHKHHDSLLTSLASRCLSLFNNTCLQHQAELEGQSVRHKYATHTGELLQPVQYTLPSTSSTTPTSALWSTSREQLPITALRWSPGLHASAAE
jgi:hypothetical protein